MFKNVSVEFMRMLSLVIKPTTYLPKQIIFGKNDIRPTLFYIKRGSVEVFLLKKFFFFDQTKIFLADIFLDIIRIFKGILFGNAVIMPRQIGKIAILSLIDLIKTLY